MILNSSKSMLISKKLKNNQASLYNLKPMNITRRLFLKNTSMGLGLTSLGVATGCLRSLFAAEKENIKTIPPEISASVFPCDVADEGMGTVFDNLQNLAGVNSAYLCNLDSSRRPFRGGNYTHNLRYANLSSRRAAGFTGSLI